MATALFLLPVTFSNAKFGGSVNGTDDELYKIKAPEIVV